MDDPPDPPDLDDLGVPVSASAQAILTAMEEAERDMFPSDDSKPTVNPALGSGPTSPAAASSPVLKSIGSMRKMPSVRLHLGDDVTLIPGISPDEGTGTPSSRGSRFGGAATQGGPKGSGGVFGATGGPPKRMGSGRIVVMDAGGDVFLSQGPAASSVT